MNTTANESEVKKEHPYAAILRAIADGDELEGQDNSGKWHLEYNDAILIEIANKEYPPQTYRIKPKTININGIEVQEPCREPLTRGTTYWIPVVGAAKLVVSFPWSEDKYDYIVLAQGIIHLTEEAAVQHMKALLSFTQIKDA